MVPAARIDGRRVDDFVREIRRYAPHYTPDLDLSGEGVGSALVTVFARLAEAITLRLDRAPQKHFVAFLDRLGIVQLPATPAKAAVTFKLATGLDSPVLVPAGARVTAPGKDAEIPFETVADLMAIPGALQAAYGVDPVEDAVYGTPLDFLKPESRTPTALVYQVLSFAGGGAERLQLDHVTDLKPGAYVRIDCRDKREVSKVDQGNIVTVRPPLSRDVEPGAFVTPIRDFEVFDGITLQEHALYLGHSGLFTVKEAAEIMLKVRLADGPGPQPSTLDLVWQFWTKSETVPGDEEHWEDLGLKADGTAGLSTSGTIVLAKPPDLEIKSRKVGNAEKRWIRALLRGKLAPGTVLSSVDSIEIGIKSGPTQGIKPDQGFSNATPLDLQVPDVGFFPFGAEPRQFDQFYIASKEAFSKPGAKVEVHFDLDLQTLATPSVAKTTAGLRAYSMGLRRRLYELDLDTVTWQMLGTPYDTPLAGQSTASGYAPLPDAVPSAISNDATKVLVFVMTEDGLAPQNPTHRLWVNHQDIGQPGTWIDLGQPPAATSIASNPAAVRVSGLVAWSPRLAQVFVVTDGGLCSRGVDDSGAPPGDWLQHGKPTGVNTLDPRLFVTMANGQAVVFLNSDKGLQRFSLKSDDTGGWTPLTPGDASFGVTSRPFAVPVGTGLEAKIFVFAARGPEQVPRLFECDTGATTGTFHWEDLGSPPGMAPLQADEIPSAPSGYLERPGDPIGQEGKHIFVRGSDNRLYQRFDGPPDLPDWVQHMRPGDPELRESPVLHEEPAPLTTVTVLAASTRNSVVKWIFERRTGMVPADPDKRVVLLDQPLPEPFAGNTLTITAGTGNGQTSPIDGHDPGAKLIRLANQFPLVPDATSQCAIDGASVGLARNGADLAFIVHPPPADALSARADRIRINNDWIPLDAYSRPTSVVILGAAKPVATGDPFELFAELAPDTTEYRATGDSGSIPELSWEYWNGRGWLSLPVTDGTLNFLTSGDVVIGSLPRIAATEVAGQESFWIRARLTGGDYGRETFKVVGTQVVSEKSSLRPPKILEVMIRYTAPPVTPESCLTANNLDYLDQTAACQLDGAHFSPFQPLPVESLTLFIGLEQPFASGPVRLLLDAAERDFDPNKPPGLTWRFRKDHEWEDLDVEDESVAMTRQGVLTLSASAALTRETLFGQALFWIRGTLREDRGAGRADYPLPLLRGLYLNTVSASQGETITDEIVGSSNGEPGQRLRLQRANVLAGEAIRVEESLSSAELERLEREGGKESVLVRDDLPGTWVRWTETKAFFNCGPDDRSYSIDRAAGELRFGDGVHGRIPPAGADNIRAFRYRTGGGAIGNVPAGTITTLATAAAGVESVINPTPAGGGSDTTDTDQMLTIGPRQISHRGRAVSATDFEELAYEASREVAKVRCLGATNLARAGAARRDPCDSRQRHEARVARGWVSLIIVPQSIAPLPCPSLELRRTVAAFLRDRAPGLVAAGARIIIRPPDYVVVGVQADVYVPSIDLAAQVERAVRQALETFLHPLRGGTEKTGWEFGRSLAKSDVFAVLERLDNVDRVESLTFTVRGQTSPDGVTIGPNQLLAGGDHVLQIKKA